MYEDKITRITEYIVRRSRSLRVWRSGGGRKVADVGRGAAPATVVLRERVYRFEISRSKITRFLKTHKRWVFGACAVLAAIVFVRYALIGLASTEDFYPSSCLGNWQNVANALGKPDLVPGAPSSSFNGSNAAVFDAGIEQMYCGNFSGSIDIAALEGKTFQKASLVLSWTFIFPQTVSASSTMATDTVADIASSTASSTVATSTATSTEVGASTSTGVGVGTSTEASTSVEAATSTTSTASSTPPADTSTPPMQSASQADTSTQMQSAPPSADSSTQQSASSFLWPGFFPVAYADDATSVATSSTAVAETTTLIINTSAFHSLTIPSSSDGDILSIEISTDGVNWTPVVNINKDNWQDASYDLPIHSWEELKNLQVAFVGLGTGPQTPEVLLDAVDVSVAYGDPGPGTTIVNGTSTQADAGQGTAAVVASAVPASSRTSDVSRIALEKVFSPTAEQRCSISPFDNIVSPGGQVSYTLTLTPTSSAASAGKGASTTFLYDASLGSLPDGVEGRIVPMAPGNDNLILATAQDSVPGSYAVIVVYRERQPDGSILPNYCQLHLNIL